MSATLSRLENVRKREDGSVVARCPACAALGNDTKGNHLVVFPSGAFGCVVFSGDTPEARQHRREVARLAGWAVSGTAGGNRSRVRREPRPVQVVPWRARLGLPPQKQPDGSDG
jgi:hypothetical protein